MFPLQVRKKGAATLCRDCVFVFYYLTSHSLSSGGVLVQSLGVSSVWLDMGPGGSMCTQPLSARLRQGVLRYPRAPRMLQAGSLAGSSPASQFSRLIH